MTTVVYRKRVLYWNHPRSKMVSLPSALYGATCWYCGSRTGPAVYRHAPAHEDLRLPRYALFIIFPLSNLY